VHDVNPRRRRYHSPLRAEQAQRTRRSIVEAATRLFTAAGYANTSLRAVAESAGVAPETVYDVFGTKRALLEAVVESAITEGIEEPADWLEHSWVMRILALDDPSERLRAWLAHTAVTLARTSPVHAVIRAAAQSDAELEVMYRRLQEERFRAHRRLIEPMLGRSVTEEESDTFSVLTSPEVHHLLTAVRGWSRRRYATWLESVVSSAVRAAAIPPPS
jgi:AcrR family transcriptional regulator